MRLRLMLCFSACLLALSWEARAQDWTDYLLDNEELAPARNQTWYWAGKKYIYEGEAIWTILMPELPVYKPLRFKSKKEQERYNKLVYNVKRVLPLAQQVNSIIQETYLVLEQLPDKKSKEAHIKMIEKELMTRYKPEMKKLTYAQGKLLIKLVDRECNQSGYDVVKAFLGPTRATFYQVFAWTFHASLKKEFDAEGDDRLIERICRQVEAGTL
ncbi:MAG: DUF4294 domain-containing protein [Prevotellaceae bacterium]|nr:DUF4294 domain-containing protein [Prevotellaceae bacterium]